ncbi:restriction endonuclease subunit S [Photobacterium kishitanii]|uniref:restriction endonuclease subunit S n=1 Tax=Photobacterium kishitanii TaxID=318456 RepID=UPI000435AE50|nr:restriction endonuclease subunit S [Photobacterium kishitanii]CEO40754.1 Restriction modification system DNA specificity domain-containing protein [Photobacterium kishitanii]
MSFDNAYVRLGDLVTLKSGNTPSKSDESYWGGVHNWASAKDLKKFYIYKTENQLTDKGIKKASRVVDEGATLILTRGMTLVKTVPICVVKNKTAFNQDLKCVFSRHDSLAPEFIPYLLLGNKERIHSLVDLAGHGTGRLATDSFLNLEVFVPEQQKREEIVKLFASIDDKITLNTQINQNLEQIAQAIFKSWFVDFDPVKAKMNGEQPEGMDAVTASLFPEKLVESELGLIPDGWNIESIKDFGNVICGKTPSKKNADFYGGDVPFIKIPDTHGKVFITETSDTLTKAGDESQPKKRIPENSICVSCIATVGQVFITTKPSHTNQQINSVVPYDQNSLYYLLFKFKGLNKHFHDLASGGSATLNMNTSTFSKVALVRPTADVLEAFHKTVGGLMEKMLANQLENTTLSELRDTLLPKLLSGEIELDKVLDV